MPTTGKLLYDLTMRITPSSDTSTSANLAKVASSETTGKNIEVVSQGMQVITTADSLNIFPVLADTADINFFGIITFDSAVAVASRTVNINVDAVGNVKHHEIFAFRAGTSAVIANATGQSVTVQWIAYKPI